MSEFDTPKRRPVRNALHAAMSAAPAQRAAAEAAATDFNQGLWPALRAEIRWAFTPPRIWLTGVVANLVLAVVWLDVPAPDRFARPSRAPSHYHHAGVLPPQPARLGDPDQRLLRLVRPRRCHHHQRAGRRSPPRRQGAVGGCAVLAGAVAEKPDPARDRGTAHLVGGDGIDAVEAITGAVGQHDPQRRGAHRVLAGRRQRHLGAVAGRLRTADATLARSAQLAAHRYLDTRSDAALTRCTTSPTRWAVWSTRSCGRGSRRRSDRCSGATRKVSCISASPWASGRRGTLLAYWWERKRGLQFR